MLLYHFTVCISWTFLFDGCGRRFVNRNYRISYSLRKMEGLRWTAHMNECLAFLSEHPEWPGDALLAAQVRIQLAIDQMGSDAANGSPASLPAYYKLSSLTLPLDTVKKQLPPGLENNGMLFLRQVCNAGSPLTQLQLRNDPHPAHLRGTRPLGERPWSYPIQS
jgi:hypothetical protein